MRILLILTLLFYSHIAKAQLHVDSLKNICIDRYQKQVVNNIPEKERIGKRPRVNVDELFQGIFNDVRIFLLVGYPLGGYDHAPSYCLLYFLNSLTGKDIEINNTEEFNNEFCQNQLINNLDKCYLYLFAIAKTEITGDITPPDNYRKSLRNNSIFLKDGRSLFYSYHFAFPPLHLTIRSQVEGDISRSTKDNIYIYAISDNTPYRYQFSFKKGKIEKIVKSVLKK